MAVYIRVAEDANHETYDLIERSLKDVTEPIYNNFLTLLPFIYLFKIKDNLSFNDFTKAYESGKFSILPVTSAYAKQKYPKAQYATHGILINKSTGEVDLFITYF